jgi:hypothetical protein
MTTPNTSISNQLKTIFNNQCSCSECSSGVSPNAYFYDLLNYSYSNFSIKTGSTYSNIGNILAFPDFFQKRFMQEMENVPINCEALNEKICQVRLAVETLWRYRSATSANNTSTIAMEALL